MNTIPQNNQKGKVLIITDEWLSPSLALELQHEGCEVMIALKRATKILKGTITRVPYAERLEYAKEASLIIYEDKSNKGEAHDLRNQGYSVIGGDKLSDKMELDRQWGNKIAGMSGVKTPEMISVSSFEEIRSIIENRGGKWVLKQCGKIDEIKGLNFVAKMDNSEDLLDFLPIMEANWIEGVKPDFVMQEKIEGYEMAVGSYWNGHEFMKDSDGDELCCENWEHKALFPGNLGESTGEQYTVMRYRKAKYSKIFAQTLDKCRELLKGIQFRGDIDINTIITKDGAYFLEFTPRLGVPATSGQLEIHQSSWYEFLKAMADGEQASKFRYDKEFTIVSWLYTKPFPFVNSHKMTEAYENGTTPTSMDEIADVMSFRMSNSEGIKVNFSKDFTNEDWSHVHPDGVQFKDDALKIANSDGYIVTVSGTGETVEKAGEKVEALMKKIIVPKSFWRNDFDRSNYHKCIEDLKKWGYDSEAINFKESGLKEEKFEKKRQDIRKLLKKAVL